MANASQLKSLLSAGITHDYFWLLLVLLIVSLVLQVAVGLLLLVLGGMKPKSDLHTNRANILNNISVGLIFAVTVVNVFIGAFGIKVST